MRDEHLTFLVLAVAVALVMFALGGVPALLLPPAFPTGERRALRAARAARRGRRSEPGVSKDHLGAPGALTAQERTGTPQSNTAPRGAGVNMPRRLKAQGGFDSRHGRERRSQRQQEVHRQTTIPTATATPVVIPHAQRRCARPNTSRVPTDSNQRTRPDRPENGPRRNLCSTT